MVERMEVFRFEDEDGERDGFRTLDANEAEAYAKKHGYKVIVQEFLAGDIIEEWEFSDEASAGRV